MNNELNEFIFMNSFKDSEMGNKLEKGMVTMDEKLRAI